MVKDGFFDKDNPQTIQAILAEAKSRGLLVIDAVDENLSDTIKIEGLVRRRADIVINNDIDKDLVKNLLEKAESIAFNKGQVMIVADPKPFIILEIYNWIKTFSPQTENMSKYVIQNTLQRKNIFLFMFYVFYRKILLF